MSSTASTSRDGFFGECCLALSLSISAHGHHVVSHGGNIWVALDAMLEAWLTTAPYSPRYPKNTPDCHTTALNRPRPSRDSPKIAPYSPNARKIYNQSAGTLCAMLSNGLEFFRDSFLGDQISWQGLVLN